MDSADSIEWQGDSEERFKERVSAIEGNGIYQGNIGLGMRYAKEECKKL